MFKLPQKDDLREYKFIDLFAGIGGFHIALASHGAECVMASEVEKRQSKVYERNYGLVPRGDITKIDAADVPAHDIISAGFPCQPWSSAGKRLGFADPRGMLIFDVIRIAKYHKPLVIFLENVKGLLSHDNGESFRVIRSALEEAGYGVHLREFDASDAWVPQKRERLFIACFRKDVNPSELPRHIPSLMNFTVEEILEDFEENLVSTIERPLNFTAPYVENHEPVRGRDKVQRLGGYGRQAQGMRVYDIYGRGVTLCAEGGGGGALTGLYKMGEGVIRKLTTLEAQRMAGFPDDFITDESEFQAQGMFGNSVRPPAVDAFLCGIIQVLQGVNARPLSASLPVEVVHNADRSGSLGLGAESLGVQVENRRFDVGLGLPSLSEERTSLDLRLGDARLPEADGDDDIFAGIWDD